MCIRDRVIDHPKLKKDKAALIMNVSPFIGNVSEYRGIYTRQHAYVKTLDGPWFLFDNIADPFQMNNLVYKPGYQKLQKEMEIVLRKELRKANDDFMPRQYYIDKWGYKLKDGAIDLSLIHILPHAFRLQRDLLDSGKIDLLFLEAAVNDRANGTDSLTQIQSLEGIIRHAKTANPNMDIIMMSFADPDKLQDYDQGKKPVEIINHELVADHYQLPSLNLAKEVRDKIQQKEFSWTYDFKAVSYTHLDVYKRQR